MRTGEPARTLADINTGIAGIEAALAAQGMTPETLPAAIENLKEVNKGNDVAAIKAAIEEAQKAFYPVAEKLYQQAGAQGEGNCGGDCGNCGSDGVVDADYETVD